MKSTITTVVTEKRKITIKLNYNDFFNHKKVYYKLHYYHSIQKNSSKRNTPKRKSIRQNSSGKKKVTVKRNRSHRL